MYDTHAIVRAALTHFSQEDSDNSITQVADLRLVATVGPTLASRTTMFYVVTANTFRRAGSWGRACVVKGERHGPNRADVEFTVYPESDSRNAEALAYMLADQDRQGMKIVAEHVGGAR